MRAEGWAWVMVTPEFDYRATSTMRRVYPTEPEVPAKNQRKLEKLGLEYDELEAVAENEEMTEAMQTRLNVLETEMEALKGTPVYDPADIAAGWRVRVAWLRWRGVCRARVHPENRRSPNGTAPGR